MLNAIIIEDEKTALKELEKKLTAVSADINIAARLHSVRQSIEYFENHDEGDIIFSDVQLTDGLSFEIFAQKSVQTPVIFITGYDDYMMMAFENNGIDYLLKPVETPELEKSLRKYNRLQEHFSHAGHQAAVQNLIRFVSQKRKTRLLVKRGLENVALRLEDIALIYTQNKVVYVLDQCSKKYLCDRTLSELETELHDSHFFRVNRQYIVNINYVRSFKAFEKVKLLLDIDVPDSGHSIVVSQETAPAFRKWMHEA